MNEIKRYDQELATTLEHLPMPSEDIAWEAMLQLLNKEEDEPVIVPFYRRWGCLLIGLLIGFLIAGGGYWYIQHSPSLKASDTTGSNSAASKADPNFQNKPDEKISHKPVDTLNKPASANHLVSRGPKVLVTTGAGDILATGKRSVRIPQRWRVRSTGAAAMGSNPSVVDQNSIKMISDPDMRISILDGNTGLNQGEDKMLGSKTGGRERNIAGIDFTDTASTPVQLETEINKSNIASTDSLANKKDSLLKHERTSQENKPDEKQQRNQWSVAAGISIYQPIKINGEPSVPYNFFGRRGTLTDYIPSTYLRLYRNKKWYLHTEFRYGAPQAVKPFEYKKELIDSTPVNYTTANFRLRKTYYHQVPISFHYFVLPQFSIGAGVIYNRFSAALADMDTYKRVGGQTDSLQSSVLVNDKKDSRFSRNHLQWSAEISYNWKRLFAGARYSRDINPFIRYNDINTGVAMEKKMQALNIFIRYELWQSKQKK